eukprot:6637369-Karenia_brevis.AAC.1
MSYMSPRSMFEDPEMKHSLSKEKKEAQRITKSRLMNTNDDQSGTITCMTEEGVMQNPWNNEKTNRMKQMPRMPRRIANCKGCGTQLQAT